MADKRDIYNNKRYATEKDASYFKKIRYSKLTNEKEFDEAFEHLNEKEFTSNMSERQRDIYKKKRFQVYGDSKAAQDKFNKLIESFMYSLSSEFTLEKVKNYIYHLANGNIHKLVLSEDGKKFVSTFIYKDVIYTDRFELVVPENVGEKSYIKVQKNMKTPFPLEKISFTGVSSRNEFRKGWNNYVKEIRRGLLS